MSDRLSGNLREFAQAHERLAATWRADGSRCSHVWEVASGLLLKAIVGGLECHGKKVYMRKACF
jgi:hypothetical protein